MTYLLVDIIGVWFYDFVRICRSQLPKYSKTRYKDKRQLHNIYMWQLLDFSRSVKLNTKLELQCKGLKVGEEIACFSILD